MNKLTKLKDTAVYTTNCPKFSKLARLIAHVKEQLRKVKMHRYLIEKNNYKLIIVVHFIEKKCICPQT